MTAKQFIFRIFFGVEVLFFGWTYFLGPQGIYALWALYGQETEVLGQVNQLEHEVGRLTRRIDAWKTNPFYKEKYARERLAMAYPNDEIYYIQ
ncbi:MAG: septum formation initiator family protein [Candidatus Babeliales bacterium]